MTYIIAAITFIAAVVGLAVWLGRRLVGSYLPNDESHNARTGGQRN